MTTPKKKPEVTIKPSKGMATYSDDKKDVHPTELRAFLRDGSSFVLVETQGLPGAREAAEEVFRKGYAELAYATPLGTRVDYYPVSSLAMIRASRVRQPS